MMERFSAGPSSHGRSLPKYQGSPLLRCALVVAPLALLACTERDAATHSTGQVPYADPARPTSAAPESEPATRNPAPANEAPARKQDDADLPKEAQTPKQRPEPSAPKDPDPPRAARSSKPTNEAACKHHCRGQWGVHGMGDRPSCNCRTTDAGRGCKDSDECEGECIAEEGRTEVTDPGPPPRGFFLGRCSEFVTAFGCHPLLMGGIREGGPQPLDEDPPTVCID